MKYDEPKSFVRISSKNMSNDEIRELIRKKQEVIKSDLLLPIGCMRLDFEIKHLKKDLEKRMKNNES